MDDENVLRDTGMDLSQLKKTATQITKPTDTDEDLTVSIGSDWASGIKIHQPVVVNTDIPQLPNDGVSLSDKNQESYDGPGLVINTNELDQQVQKAPAPPGLSYDVMDSIGEYMQEYDKDTAEIIAKKEEEAKQKKLDDDEESDEMTQDEFNRTYNEAVVIIDKTGMGNVINFTDAERDKLERAKKIILEEVETISLKTIKSKKIKKKDGLETLIKRHSNIHSTPIVLLASGYTATIRGCSTYEVMALMNDSQNALLDTEKKWSLIHSKIEDTSIGKMEYNDFLHHTAAIDYNIFLYGLLCATYPDDDKITLKCEKCPTEFSHLYSVKSLIRAEKMTEAMKHTVSSTIDASHSVESAKSHYAEAPVSNTKTIKLPVSGIIVDVFVQSAYDFINKSIKELSENKEVKYNQASVLSSVVNKMFIPDPDNEEEYYEIEGAFEIAKVIYSLTDNDIIILTKQGDSILEGLSFEFGLMNVQCPNCKYHTQSLPMDLEAILFYKYQQAMSTKVE